MKARHAYGFLLTLLTTGNPTTDECQGTFVATLYSEGEEIQLRLVFDRPHRRVPVASVDLQVTQGRERLPEELAFGGQVAWVYAEIDHWLPGIPDEYQCRAP